MIEPSPEIPNALLATCPPGRSPSPTQPVPAVQRSATKPPGTLPMPEITDPSFEIAVTSVLDAPKFPIDTMPVAAVQRKGLLWLVTDDTETPPIVEPSPE